MQRRLSLTLFLVAACVDDVRVDLPTEQTESPVAEGDASTREVFCDQAPDGTTCGLEMHCLFNACVANACGDGIVAAREECDDGNERNGDGCDERCREEPAPCDAGASDGATCADAGV